MLSLEKIFDFPAGDQVRSQERSMIECSVRSATLVSNSSSQKRIQESCEANRGSSAASGQITRHSSLFSTRLELENPSSFKGIQIQLFATSSVEACGATRSCIKMCSLARGHTNEYAT